MRAAALFLVVVNVLVAVWLYTRPVDVPQPAPAGLQAPPLLLLSELPEGDRKTAVQAVDSPVLEPIPSPGLAECVAVGPFADRDAVIAARDRLMEAGLVALPTAEDASERLGFWVHTPPAASREAAAATIDRLRRAGVRDFYLVTDGEIPNAISLGVFGQPEAANQHATRLRGLGFDVRVGERRRLLTAWWLGFQAPDADTPAAAAVDALLVAGGAVRVEPRRCE